jgi:hypothetical protein
MWWKSGRKRENALLEKLQKAYFQPCFLLKLSQNNLLEGFYIKKKYSLYILQIILKTIFHIKLLYITHTLKLSKQKKVLNIFLFFFTVYRVAVRLSAEVSQRLENIQALLKVRKNEATVHSQIGVKGITQLFLYLYLFRI